MNNRITLWNIGFVCLAGIAITAGGQQVTTKQQTTTAQKQQTATVQYERPAPLRDRPSLILKRVGYIASYNKQTRTPIGWHGT